jgi:hypothetical protein
LTDALVDIYEQKDPTQPDLLHREGDHGQKIVVAAITTLINFIEAYQPPKNPA